MQTQDSDLLQGSKMSEIAEQVKNNNVLESKKSPSSEEIQAWIVSYVANLLEVEPDELDITIPFSRYGLDSSAAVGLTGDLEDWLQYEIDPTLLYDYPTIQSLVNYLSANLN